MFCKLTLAMIINSLMVKLDSILQLKCLILARNNAPDDSFYYPQKTLGSTFVMPIFKYRGNVMSLSAVLHLCSGSRSIGEFNNDKALGQTFAYLVGFSAVLSITRYVECLCN